MTQIIVLILLGLCLGSFVNALVWRLHKQSKASKKLQKIAKPNYSIMRGRSMCVHCKHHLGFFDLIPVLSWLALRGRCRYCRKPISRQYPLVELSTAAIFVGSYVFWPNNLQGIEYLSFALWLTILTGFMALVVYDLRWMLLPNKIIFFLYGVAVLYVGIGLSDNLSTRSLFDLVMSIIIGGGIFFLLFQYSKGKWIGGGDVKLGFLIGAIVMSPYLALLALFIASLLGCVYVLILILAKKTTRSTRIPFGPFLIAGAVITVLFGSSIIDAYMSLVLGPDY